MPLRLRRGTDTERQLITPQEGELIYVTDTKALWAGDGFTQGGIKVTGDIPENLDDLTDIDLTIAPQIGQVLKWNGVAFVASNDIDTDTFNAGIVEGSNYRINIASDDSTIMVDTLTREFFGNLFGTVVGDVQGSVFGDDSNVLVDGVNNVIRAISYKSPTNTSIFGNGESESPSAVIIESVDTFGVLELTRTSDSDLAGIDTVNYGMIRFNRNDINNDATTGLITARENAMLFSSTATSSFADSTNYFSFKEKKFGIGTITPTETLDVNGNAVISGTVDAASFKGSLVADDSTIIVDAIDGSITASNFIQFGRLSSVERDALTAVNGMVIYNTTDNKFQGYENDSWVNLI